MALGGIINVKTLAFMIGFINWNLEPYTVLKLVDAMLLRFALPPRLKGVPFAGVPPKFKDGKEAGKDAIEAGMAGKEAIISGGLTPKATMIPTIKPKITIKTIMSGDNSCRISLKCDALYSCVKV